LNKNSSEHPHFTAVIMPEITTIKAPCRNCHRETIHAVLCADAETADDFIEGVGSVWWRTTSEMLKCRGCGAVSLRQSELFSEGNEPAFYFYPPRVSRRRPSWNTQLPLGLLHMMNEVYSALDADNRRLALMGARTVLDMLMLDKVGDTGTFEQKLKAMEELGFVTVRGREFLDAALDAGNAAAHRGYNPKAEDLARVMDIIENMLQNVYVLEDAARTLRERTPPRHARKQRDEAP
jgi:hypothetical protein